jgi:hypothetical protein
MRLNARFLIAASLLVFWGIDAIAGGGEARLLGSPEFRPTPQRPIGWRGDGSGRFAGATPPTEWSATENVKWSATVGRSYSSPIVVGESVLVMSEPDLLISLERGTGKVRWRLEITPADLADAKSRATAAVYQPPKDGSGMTAATPISDGRAVYVVLANGIVGRVGLEGKLRWTTFIDAEPSTAYGRSASPIMADGAPRCRRSGRSKSAWGGNSNGCHRERTILITT